MRSFFWSLLFTVILLIAFAQIATPFIEHKSVPHTLPVHRTLYLDRNIDDEELLYILQAVTEWNQVTDGQVVFDIKRLPRRDPFLTGGILVINVSPDYPEVILLDNLKGNLALGFFHSDDTVPYIGLVDKRLNDKIYPQVVLHELGHSLGLEHVDGIEGIGTLMFPTIDAGSEHITKSDLYHFCKLYNCDSSKFHGISEIQ